MPRNSGKRVIGDRDAHRARTQRRAGQRALGRTISRVASPRAYTVTAQQSGLDSASGGGVFASSLPSISPLSPGGGTSADDSGDPDTGLGYFVCGFSACGGSDVVAP
jgi:hypothetical protein